MILKPPHYQEKPHSRHIAETVQVDPDIFWQSGNECHGIPTLERNLNRVATSSRGLGVGVCVCECGEINKKLGMSKYLGNNN